MDEGEDNMKFQISELQDDLNIVLEEISEQGRPAKQSLDQLEYDLIQLQKVFDKLKNMDEAHEMNNLATTAENVLAAYRTDKKTTHMRVDSSTVRKLKRIKKLNGLKGLDDTINFLISKCKEGSNEGS